jgi:hypothetical protein
MRLTTVALSPQILAGWWRMSLRRTAMITAVSSAHKIVCHCPGTPPPITYSKLGANMFSVETTIARETNKPSIGYVGWLATSISEEFKKPGCN